MFRSPRDKRRWLSAKNVGEKTIPSFGVCTLDITEGDGFQSVSVDGGELVYHV